MGTRHNIRVQVDGQIKVRNYGQWDGYPTGQGAGIAKFLQEEMNLDRFKDALRDCRFMTSQEIDAFSSLHDGEEGVIPGPPTWPQSYPWLSRDAGSRLLLMIQDNPSARLLIESKDDEDDSTWVEYFYLIDMDAKTVTVTSRHKDFLPATLGFAEWTEDAMNRLEHRVNEEL